MADLSVPYNADAAFKGCPFHRNKAVAGEDGLADIRNAGLELLRHQDYPRAVDLLRTIAAKDATGESDALLADAYFMQLKYEDAERHYKAALNKNPAQKGWAEKVQSAVTNHISRVDLESPPRAQFIARFTEEKLTAGPSPGEYDLDPLRYVIQKKGFDRFINELKIKIGEAGGAVGGAVLHQLTQLVGKHIGYKDEIWTNWYRDTKHVPIVVSDMLKILKLAYMREKLFENNLVRTYPDGANTAFYDKGEAGPPTWALYARTDDGSWNWLPRNKDGSIATGADKRHDPMVGAAMTRFFHNVGDDLGLKGVKVKESPGTDPVNVLEISKVFMTREGPMKEVPFLNLSAAFWIQFMNHDWVSHGDNRADSIDKVPIPEGHWAREKYHTEFMPVQRTQIDPTRRKEDGDRPPTFINEVTHWWDGSQIYGSNTETIKKVRSKDGRIVPDGKIHLTPEGNLPVDPLTKVEVTGFSRNWSVGLAMFHTLFAREHNAICDMLKAKYPQMSGDELFAKARLINAAVMAKIHTVEWTPAILPNKALYEAMHANWYGLLTQLFDSRQHKKALSELNIKNRELGGIIGNPQGTFAKYALSEEFTAVYRLHSLLPDIIKIIKRDGSKPVDLPLGQTRQAASPKITNRVGMEDLWRSFGQQHPGALVPNNYPKTLQDLSTPDYAFQDLAALDLYRDRERGVPSFNQLRRELSLNPIKTFDDISPDPAVATKLRQLYGQTNGKDNVDNIDLLVGTLAEGYRPEGYGFGETLFQVFILNASWRLLGDRFFTDDYRPEVYTQEGLDWIDQASLKSVQLRHYPGLANSGLANVKNSFEPHDEGELDPKRHPLRGYDKALKANPWRGDNPPV